MSHPIEVRAVHTDSDRQRLTEEITFLAAWSAIIAACVTTWSFAIRLIF